MKVVCKSKKLLQDKLNPKQFYEYNKEYDVNEETGKRLIESKKFEEVKPSKKANKDVIEESAK